MSASRQEWGLSQWEACNVLQRFGQMLIAVRAAHDHAMRYRWACRIAFLLMRSRSGPLQRRGCAGGPDQAELWLLLTRRGL